MSFKVDTHPDEGASLTFSVSLLNLIVIVLLVVSLAAVNKGLLGMDVLLLTATVATGTVWAWRHSRRNEPRAVTSPAVKLAAGVFPIILIVFAVRSFVAEPFAIPSGSMLPTLQQGDLILVNKYAYGIRLPVLDRKIFETGHPARGDVAVFRAPETPDIQFVKRVIGLPGDMVVYANKRLTINGLPAMYTETGDVRGTFGRGWVSSRELRENIQGNGYPILLSPGTPAYYPEQVLPFANRSNCAYQGNGFACRVPAGHYLVLGDNRDASKDSRYWGFVPDENLVGRVKMVLMNMGSPSRIGQGID